VAREASTVITVLTTGDVVRQVYSGDGGLIAQARPGSLLIDCSTIEPTTSVHLAAQAELRDIGFADAGLGALPKDALEGRIHFMYGCAPELSARVEQVLAPLAATLVRCGPAGSGMTMKIINNLLANAIHVADLEAINLADRAGLDREVVLRVLGTTAAGNNYLRDRVPAELADTVHQPGFRIDLGAKDARLGQELARNLGLAPPVLFTGAYLLHEAQQLGFGDRALSALFTTLQRICDAAPTQSVEPTPPEPG
jgi:3-hydroxyisobutyrate dehydrogenase-like beta-hydroxyacid dehydrogenase